MNLRLIYNNLWRDGTIIGQSSENPQFPAIDTQIDTKEQFWRSIGLGSPDHISCDIGANGTEKTADFVAILGHNFSQNAVIKMIGASNSGFTEAVEEVVIPYNEGDICYFFPAAITRRYWKVQVTDAGNSYGYLQVATISLGKAFAPNKNFGPGYSEGSKDYTEKEYSDSRVLFSQEKPIVDIGRYPFRGLDNVTRKEILKFFKKVGTKKAYILCFDKDSPNTTSWFVVNEDLIAPVYVKDNVWTWELSVEEVL